MSNGDLWTIGGLLSDIVGASLLAVEAIKLENIRKLTSLIRIRVEVPLKSQPFKPDDPEAEIWKIPAEELRAMSFGGRGRLYNAAHIVCGWIALIAIYLAVRQVSGFDVAAVVNSWILSQNIWLTLFLYAILAIVLNWVVAWMLGEYIIHHVIGRSIETIIAVLGFIDEKTPNGTTGIIGFAFMFVGFVGQIVGAIVNG